jgi:hypothetical protein
LQHSLFTEDCCSLGGEGFSPHAARWEKSALAPEGIASGKSFYSIHYAGSSGRSVSLLSLLPYFVASFSSV